jgi:hypothetical protein
MRYFLPDITLVRPRAACATVTLTAAFLLTAISGAAARDLVPWKGSAMGMVTATAPRPDGSTLVDAKTLGEARYLGETSTLLRYTATQGADSRGKPIVSTVGDGTLHAANGDQLFITFHTVERLQRGKPPFRFAGKLRVVGGTGRFVGATGRAKVHGVDQGDGRFAYAFHGRLSFPGKTSPPPAPAVDDILKVPEGNVVLFRALGKGVQIYVCTGGVWTFKAPEADLFDDAGKKIGIHYAGPTWESLGGSKVVAARLQGSPSPDATAIPWLLLQARSNEGAGALSAVTYIQRVSTTGGLAPTGACGVEEAEARVEYTALYYFFGPAK